MLKVTEKSSGKAQTWSENMIFVYQGEPAVIFTNSFQHCKLTWAFHVRCTSLWYSKERGSWLLLFLVSSWGISGLCPLLKQRFVSRTGVALASSTSCLLTQICFKSYKNQIFLRRTAISLCCVWWVTTPVSVWHLWGGWVLLRPSQIEMQHKVIKQKWSYVMMTR